MLKQGLHVPDQAVLDALAQLVAVLVVVIPAQGFGWQLVTDAAHWGALVVRGISHGYLLVMRRVATDCQN
jgi:hypothetical protein